MKSKIQRQLWLLGIFKIPMIGFIRPKLIDIDDDKVVVKVRLKRRSKNHLKSMYFGALAIGADIAAGIHVFYFANSMDKKISFAFKSVQAEFLKRAESDTTFECVEGEKIKSMILKSIESKARVNGEVIVSARNSEDEIVATFVMGVSVKVK